VAGPRLRGAGDPPGLPGRRPAAARLDRGRGRPPPPGQGPPRAGAVPAHRPGKTATPGARRPGSSPRRRASRSTRCGSATSTATCTTRAAPGSASGRSPATARSWSARTGSSSGGTRPAPATPGRPGCRAQPDPRPAGGSGGQSGTASASFSATSFRSACRRASSSSCKALAMAASCSLATFTLASARPALGLRGLRLGLCGFRRRLAPGMFAHDPLLASEPQRAPCLALGHEAAAQRAIVCEYSHAGDPRGTRCCPEASTHRSPPSLSALRKA
jgi:hypothetical protein